jgi:hypothetical protein
MTSLATDARFDAVLARRNQSDTMNRRRSTDDQLLVRLLAPPDLDDGVQSLDYWRGRSRRLPWYRWGARREAV